MTIKKRGISKDLGDILKKSKASRQVGETKVGSDGITRVWTDLGGGKFDWRRVKNGSKTTAPSGTKKVSALSNPETVEKLKKTIENSTEEKLVQWASKKENNPRLRLMAFAELEKRGVDTSDIDMNNGKLGELKNAMGKNSGDSSEHEDFLTDVVDETIDEEDLEEDWHNIDLIKTKLGLPLSDKKMTKKQRIILDDYIHQLKIQQPNYRPPAEEIFDLNKTYAYFLEEGAPLMIASGGAGVGKTHNFKLVAEKGLGLKPFDPETDEPGDNDYDYVEAPEAKSVPQLLQILKDHNGKIILFDDADQILKEDETLNILKKATNPSGKRMIGKQSSNKSTNFPTFEFTGQIIFLTNMSQYELTKDENMSAIYSRAIKKDIYFTKKEQLSFMSRLRHQFDFTGVKRLSDSEMDKEERDDVFKLISDNIDSIDPAKFNSRLMMEVLAKKRAIDKVNEKFEKDPILSSMLYGDKSDWKEEVKELLVKGGLSRKDKLEQIEKAKQLLKLQ